jgi:CelD/BcsL family acetyltransferase involved in cellulose biosynthesis
MKFKRYKHFNALTNDKSTWNNLLEKSAIHVPFLRFEYLSAWWETRGGGEWPEESELVIILAFEDDEMVGIAPLFCTADESGKSHLMFIGSHEVSDYLDFIVEPNRLDAFLTGLFDFLTQHENAPDFEVIDLYNLLSDSPTLALLEQSAADRGWQHQDDVLQPAPYIPLPGDHDTYLMAIDKKQRHEIRRKLRNVEQSLMVSDLYILDDEDRLHADTQAFIDMMAQDPNKKAFLTEAMQKHLHHTARAAFENGWLHLAFFTLDGNKAAGNMSFLFNNKLWLYNSGWEWNYRDFSPGWVLLANLIQWANDHQIEVFDFMRGNERYKYKFGAQDRFVHRVVLTP